MSKQILHYQTISGVLLVRDESGMLSWRCPDCKEEGQSKHVLKRCPVCKNKEGAK